MGEIKGYVCDGGCGATTTTEGIDSIARQGWWTTFTPSGYPTLYTCGPRCLIKAIGRIQPTIEELTRG